MRITDRFWDKVDIGSREECWLWSAYCLPSGYGRFHVNTKTEQAHRYSFFLANDFYPPVVMHSCDNPQCVNPSHLLAGTAALNVADCAAKGRNINPNGNANKTHCPSGHPYNETNTYIAPKGSRACRVCNLLSHYRYVAKSKTP
jgi:hypothetical protein